MQIFVVTPDQYIDQLPDDRKLVVSKLRQVLRDNIPEGFEETVGYGMIGYVVPHSIYPAGYHCDPKLPLPFMGLASQKNFVALYHMGLYSNKELMSWFVDEYPKYSKAKLDMGKSCIRLKKMDQIPYELIAELSRKITVKEWIETYEIYFKNKKNDD
jgi:uncharacterized protein YdhG (YjbR/CyaY superfamily)